MFAAAGPYNVNQILQIFRKLYPVKAFLLTSRAKTGTLAELTIRGVRSYWEDGGAWRKA